MTDEIIDLNHQSGLDDLLASAFGSYYHFVQKGNAADAKDFAAYHTACKAAVAHIAALVKLRGSWAKSTPASQSQNDELEDLLRQTRLILLGAGNDNYEEDQF